MNVRPFLLALAAWLACTLLFLSSSAGEPEAAWKTAYFKRGFVGNLRAASVGGEDATLRVPLPLYSPGTKVRVWLKSARDTDTEINRPSFSSLS